MSGEGSVRKAWRDATLRGGAALEASLEMAHQHWCMLRNTESTEVVPRQKNKANGSKGVSGGRGCRLDEVETKTEIWVSQSILALV